MSAGRFAPAIRIGRSVRFRPEDVAAWLDSQA
jgi:predicted DNA-binding transcriptional regulator AlpA